MGAKLGFFDLLKLLPLIASLLRDAVAWPADWTDPAAVQAWLHECEPELAGLIAEAAKLIRENVTPDDPVIVEARNRLTRALGR